MQTSSEAGSIATEPDLKPGAPFLSLLLVEEAKTWLGTPWHHEARVKGEGVDCGMLLLEVFERTGLIPHIVPPHYSKDFMMHRTEEWYYGFVTKRCEEVKAPFHPGDVVLFKYGRIFSHGGLVSEWPFIIHASSDDRKVCYGNIDQHPLSRMKRRVFRHRSLL